MAAIHLRKPGFLSEGWGVPQINHKHLSGYVSCKTR